MTTETTETYRTWLVDRFVEHTYGMSPDWVKGYEQAVKDMIYTQELLVKIADVELVREGVAIAKDVRKAIHTELGKSR